jgi:aminoglycoside phosphotransferase (APT) family kinase protein
VEGITMMEAIQKMPWRLFPLTRQLAALHLDMHSRKAANLPKAHDVLTYKINHASPLDEETKERVLNHLDRLPRDDKLLHGDFHPGNILLTPNGPVIIDWIDATAGHPLADVTRTSLLARVSSASPSNAVERLMALFGRLFHHTYIEHYFKQSPYEEKELYPWLLPVTAGRLSENIPHERDALVRLVMGYLDRVN